MLKVNLGCGPVFVDSPDWLNLDFSPTNPAVRKANLLDRLPLGDGTVSLVYSSHFLEHVPRAIVPVFLRECLNVLQPGGFVRLVVPDLEDMAREYLAMREAGEHDKADFVVMEIIDQGVRCESGGELGRFYRQMTAQSGASASLMIDYIRARTGDDLRLSPIAGGGQRTLNRVSANLRNRVVRAWIRVCLLALPAVFRAQNVSLAAMGERHHWLWDFQQLKSALEAVGFVDVQRRSANSSAIADFPFQPLDLDVEDRPRKGAESLYVEARKPG